MNASRSPPPDDEGINEHAEYIGESASSNPSRYELGQILGKHGSMLVNIRDEGRQREERIFERLDERYNETQRQIEKLDVEVHLIKHRVASIDMTIPIMQDRLNKLQEPVDRMIEVRSYIRTGLVFLGGCVVFFGWLLTYFNNEIRALLTVRGK